jgi:hypothetical protein
LSSNQGIMTFNGSAYIDETISSSFDFTKVVDLQGSIKL